MFRHVFSSQNGPISLLEDHVGVPIFVNADKQMNKIINENGNTVHGEDNLTLEVKTHMWKQTRSVYVHFTKRI